MIDIGMAVHNATINDLIMKLHIKQTITIAKHPTNDSIIFFNTSLIFTIFLKISRP